MKKCYIVGAGDFSGFIFPDGETFIIAADGGCDSLKKAGITPDIILGDFDSSEKTPEGENVIKFRTDKDYSDTFLASQKAYELGYREMWFFGCLGGRIDHSYANIQTIAHFSKKGVLCRIFSDKYEILALTNGEVSFDESERGYVSVFSFDGVSRGVCISGLKYTLNDSELYGNMPLGLSNEFLGKEAFVSVKSGTLIIIKERRTVNG